MALNYDFDMFAVGRADFADEVSSAVPGGLRHDGKAAVFRDPRTAAALARAPQVVQDYLRAAGFGSGTGHSGAPDGRYPAADEAARTALIEALTANIGAFQLPQSTDARPDPDAFFLPAFFEAVISAEPLPPDAPLMTPRLPGDIDTAGVAAAQTSLRGLKLPFRAPRWLIVIAAGALAAWSARAV